MRYIRSMKLLLAALVVIISLSFADDPFERKENAVGYIVLEHRGKVLKYIVLESEEGQVKLIQVDKDPSEIIRGWGEER